MKTYFDKYISEQVQSVEDNLQIDDWGNFQARYAKYKRKKAMRFIIPAVAAASVFVAFILSGRNEIGDEMKCINKPVAIIADNVPAIRTEIPVCKETLTLMHRYREANPVVLDTVHNDIPDKHPEVIADKKDESANQNGHIENEYACKPYSSSGVFQTDIVTEEHRKRGVKKFSIGLAAAPGMYSRDKSFVQLNAPDGILSGGREEIHYKHFPPVTMGVSVGIHLGKRLSFTTGLDYSIYLSQKETKAYDYTKTETQQLHYLGLPVMVSYSLYSGSSFEWYAGGGFLVEKYINGKSGTAMLKEKNLLWSAAVTTGFQYNFMDNLSLYCEPYCSYLFSDTALLSYRSDNPLCLSVRLGLRIRLFNRE